MSQRIEKLMESVLPREYVICTEFAELITESYKETKGDPECCGFGGVFSVKYPELSSAISDRRILQMSATGAEYVTGADDSCLNHISQGLLRSKSGMRTIHIARVLASEKDRQA